MRILLYAHNAIGLGHIVRLCRVGSAVKRLAPEADVLLLTGLRRNLDQVVPSEIEVVKLPSLTGAVWRGKSVRLPATLNLSLAEFFVVRASIVSAVAASFQPHVLVVDHLPGGVSDELVPALTELSTSGRCSLVFGMRGFHQVDAGQNIFKRGNNFDLLTSVYDAILIFNDPDVVDVAQLYALPIQLERRLEYVGYVAPEIVNVRAEAGRSDKLRVVVTTGGGWQSYPVIRKAIDAATLDGAIELDVLAGPYLDEDHYSRLVAWGNQSGVSVKRYSSDVVTRLTLADIVVCRGGYNTLAEVMAGRHRAVCIPREHPDTEQLMHAERLQEMGILEVVREAASPEDLRKALQRAKAVETRALRYPSLDGATRAAKRIIELAATG